MAALRAMVAMLSLLAALPLSGCRGEMVTEVESKDLADGNCGAPPGGGEDVIKMEYA